MRVRIALATAPLLLLLWLGIGAYLLQKQHAGLNGAEQASRNVAQAFEENIRRTIEAIDTTIRAARMAQARDRDHFDLRAWERDSGLTHGMDLQLSLADRTGNVIASNLTDNLGPISIADREQFRLPRDSAGDALFIIGPAVGRVPGQWSVQFARKLQDAAGDFDGVIIASLDPALLSRFYNSLGIKHGALMLLGRDGIVRSSAPDTFAQPGSNLTATSVMAGASAAAQGTARMANTIDGIERIYSWRRIDDYGVVAVGLSTADALADFRSEMPGFIAIGVLLTLLILVIGMVLARNRRDLVLSRQMLQAAVANISQGLMVVDHQRRVPVINDRLVELLDLPSDFISPGFSFDDLLQWQVKTGEFVNQDSSAVRLLVNAGGLTAGSSVYTRTRGNGTVLEVRTKMLASGMAVRTFTDITEQQRAAHALADARDVAEAAARARSEFLAVMSHEIRTPLNGVIGVADLLDEMELGAAQRDHVRLIRQSGDHLLQLINDILDFSRLDAGRVQLEEVDFDPRALVRGVVNMLLTQANAKGLHLSARIADAVPVAVAGDPGRLRQILINLVGNAIKFTDAGWISLTMAYEPVMNSTEPAVTRPETTASPEAAPGARLLLGVADSGIGIDPEAIDRMFQEFTQIDGSISRRFGGSGLGLAICRRLVERMGGTIAVDSRPGIGSTFRFDVVLRQSAAGPAIDPVPDTELSILTGLRILVAEDNPTNRLVATRLLERLGHYPEAVGNGAEAIAALNLARYDLVLMDVMMPEMDGLTAARCIREAEPQGSRIAIVGLTAGSSKENLAACLAAGMDAVTTKPVTLARLRAAISDGRDAAQMRHTFEGDAAPNLRLRQLTKMLGEDAVAEIVDAFAEDAQRHLVAMRAAAADGNSSAIYLSAHSVAGAARNVGADTLADIASSLERTLGSLSPAMIVAELAAMQTALDIALRMTRQTPACNEDPVPAVVCSV